jgi:hypothetical protein
MFVGEHVILAVVRSGYLYARHCFLLTIIWPITTTYNLNYEHHIGMHVPKSWMPLTVAQLSPKGHHAVSQWRKEWYYQDSSGNGEEGDEQLGRELLWQKTYDVQMKWAVAFLRVCPCATKALWYQTFSCCTHYDKINPSNNGTAIVVFTMLLHDI